MTENTAVATQHGKERIKERIGIGYKGADRQVNLALERGLTHKDCKSRLLKWVDSQILKGKKENTAFNSVRIFNSKLFIFDGDEERLITVINVPKNLQPIINKIFKKKLELKEEARGCLSVSRHHRI